MISWAKLIYEAWGVNHPRIFILGFTLIGAFLGLTVALLVRYGYRQAKSREQTTAAVTSPQVELRLRSDHAVSNLKPVRFAIPQYGGYNTQYGHASAVSLSVWNGEAGLVHVTTCKLVRLPDATEKTVALDLLIAPGSSDSIQASDLTVPILELLLGSPSPGSVNWDPATHACQIEVEIQYQMRGQSLKLGPSLYHVETKASGTMTITINLTPQ